MIRVTHEDYSKCSTEQSFKMLYINAELKTLFNNIFCIETEETVKGFPDVMEVVSDKDSNITYFYEFKISDKNGNIKFQPTQPSFYKSYSGMSVHVIALNRKTNNVHYFNVKELFDSSSPYKISLNNRVNLCAVEEAYESIDN